MKFFNVNREKYSIFVIVDVKLVFISVKFVKEDDDLVKEKVEKLLLELIFENFIEKGKILGNN